MFLTPRDIGELYGEEDLAKQIFPQVEKGGRNFVPTYHHDTYPFVDPSKVDLSGKRVLITGASYGIGRVIAISYAKAGASVVALAARSGFGNIEKELQDAAITAGRSPPKVLIYQLDVTNACGVEDAAKKFAQHSDSLDILINNAGYGSTWDFTDQTDPDDWWKIWEVNVKGTWLVTKYFLPLLLKSELRTVVLFTSIASVMVAAGGTSYPISKFAVSRMAEVFATEYEKEGLVAIAFNPGDIPTSLSRKLPGKASMISQDKPELAGDTLVFLTKERRQWLSGRMITSNWDMEEFLAKRDQITIKDLLKFRLDV
ncbi:unnamed protein product [Clonostachys rosea f. rosea IK726]|jgi:NAD(P)-dependent dehydrogenase (short-subunit alcohol dehydrogenase family)|uniref:Uncharacterized protein n=2 Tax=Bionectria ochroleuca TaxID=29856 RepID=A0A0B7KRY3_BIOOC|nr:unnamed protein product [Clonostachys rosea f. rosea IK726]